MKQRTKINKRINENKSWPLKRYAYMLFQKTESRTKSAQLIDRGIFITKVNKEIQEKQVVCPCFIKVYNALSKILTK